MHQHDPALSFLPPATPPLTFLLLLLLCLPPFLPLFPFHYASNVHRRERDQERRLGKEDKTYPKARRPKESTKREVGRRKWDEVGYARRKRDEFPG